METDPIKVTNRDGMWEVDYGGGTTQNFPSRGEAEQAARRIADDEGRDVEIEE
jgi:Uncharacterized protein conserved in bacteria (DUF2188)